VQPHAVKRATVPQRFWSWSLWSARRGEAWQWGGRCRGCPSWMRRQRRRWSRWREQRWHWCWWGWLWCGSDGAALPTRRRWMQASPAPPQRFGQLMRCGSLDRRRGDGAAEAAQVGVSTGLGGIPLLAVRSQVQLTWRQCFACLLIAQGCSIALPSSSAGQKQMECCLRFGHDIKIERPCSRNPVVQPRQAKPLWSGPHALAN